MPTGQELQEMQATLHALSQCVWWWWHAVRCRRNRMQTAYAISRSMPMQVTAKRMRRVGWAAQSTSAKIRRSEEHTSELQSLMRNSYAVFCLNNKTKHRATTTHIHNTRAK